MKRSLAIAFAVAALFPALLAAPAGAELLSLKVGGQVGGSHTGGDIDATSFIGGGVARLELLSILTGELAVNYKKDDIEVDGEKVGDIETIPIQISALITFLPIVYGTIGVGYYNVSANDDITDQVEGLDDLSDAALHLGFGAEIPISSRWSVMGDVRYVFLDYNVDNVDEDVFDSSASFTTFTGGVLVKLF
jgi:outer membrane protein with beta-barrel domain